MDDAVARWLTASQGEKRRRVSKDRPPLAPWVENAYFDLPVCTVVTLSGSINGDPLVSANPNRVVLLLSPANTTVQIFPDNDPQTANGLVITSTFQPFVFTQREHGPLASMAWRATGGLNTKVYVVELILREWP